MRELAAEPSGDVVPETVAVGGGVEKEVDVLGEAEFRQPCPTKRHAAEEREVVTVGQLAMAASMWLMK